MHLNTKEINGLTAEELLFFDENGYLLIKNAVPPDQCKILLDEVMKLVDEARDEGRDFHEEYYHKNSFKLVRVLRDTTKFDCLIDHPSYFGKLVSLLGTHLQLMGTEVFVRGSADETITGFHTDLGLAMQSLLSDNGNPYLQIKTQVFLTDLSQKNSSNFALFPGSHRNRVEEKHELCLLEKVNKEYEASGEISSDAIQILAEPGDVLLFTHTLWHAVSRNLSDRTRYSISFRYGQLVLRPLERFDPILADNTREFTERQRRLLGDLGDINPSPYRPVNQEEIIYEAAAK